MAPAAHIAVGSSGRLWNGVDRHPLHHRLRPARSKWICDRQRRYGHPVGHGRRGIPDRPAGHFPCGFINSEIAKAWAGQMMAALLISWLALAAMLSVVAGATVLLVYAGWRRRHPRGQRRGFHVLPPDEKRIQK
jgi:hypothetical protein